MPLQATSGAASYDAFGGGVPVVPNYIEEVFGTFLYTGNGSTQTITNGIDLAGKGGLVWIKGRSSWSHYLQDTARGIGNELSSNTTNASGSNNYVTAVSATGFSLAAVNGVNQNTAPFASWTFRKQPKFFDVVTWTGSGANRTIAHNLGSVPGCIIVKRTDTTGDWQVYHQSLANTQYMVLNSTAAVATGATRWNSTTPTSTVFSVGTDATVNASGGTYVAYIFAHNAGGFGLTGTDNVISCGSYTGNGSATGPVVSLGYEPQWLMVKNATGTGNWQIIDNMRGMPVGSADATLQANLANAETAVEYVSPTATGFQITSTSTEVNTSASTYIYIAIRRGPMKVPTDGTKVLSVKTYSATTTSAQVTHDVTFDMEMNANRNAVTPKFLMVDSLRGINGVALETVSPAGEASYPTYWSRKDQRTMYAPSSFDSWWASDIGTNSHISYGFVRAPGFFDEVCYQGTGVSTTQAHNLGVAPELLIVKSRSGTQNWPVYAAPSGNSKVLYLNTAWAQDTSSEWDNTTPMASVFSLNSSAAVNQSGSTYVAYLFATCPGVSKVGSYTGNGSTQTINCGFTGGARFVLIKRTDSTGDWYVWDSARGIVAGNDSYLLLNSTAAEVTNTDYIDTYSAGFEISSTAPAAINASGGSFIFFAVA